LSNEIDIALAVLTIRSRYVLQLRDNLPHIAAPGMWALFGGRIEANESAQQALVREIKEELGIELRRYRFWRTLDAFNEFFNCTVRYWVFEADVTQSWAEHQLFEGQDAGDFNFNELDNLQMPPIIRSLLTEHHCRLDLSVNSTTIQK
jgi:8-oxo-dGTP pyrophosphatase MutT (NUDIX family)